MITFLLVFFSVYTGMHAVFFLRVRSLVPGGGLGQILFGVFLVAMIFAPVCTRLLERGGWETAARIGAYVGYSWLGFIFLSFCVIVATGLVEAVFRLAAPVMKTAMPGILSANATTVSLLLFVTALCVYGFVDARNIRVERVVVQTEKLPPGIDRLRIVQISDLHLGLIVRGERLQKIVEIASAARPDLLVSTGDLIDGEVGDVEELARQFDRIRARYGKFAVTGNHEYIAGVNYSLPVTERLGFKLLHNAVAPDGNPVAIVGVNDPMGGRTTDEAGLLRSVRNGRFVLFLKHRPEPQEASLGLFDLQLSGHTHRGQIFPFSLLTARVYPLQDGLYELGKGSKLYTSRGTGTWGPPMRVLSPPEVTVIELERKSATGGE